MNGTPAATITGPDKKIRLLMRIMILGWIAAKCISWRLWLKDRLLPLAPVSSFTDWPPLMHYLLFAASMALLVLLLFKPQHWNLLLALLLSELLACLGDQMRWQPWEYQYLFTILLCLLFRNQPKHLLAGIALMMGGTYLYSGLGKLNEGYLVLVWDRLFLQYVFKVTLAMRQNWWIYHSGYITSLIEIILAIGLFFRPTQKIAAWGTIAMHLLILYAIGPLGTDYNHVVWPWNVVMILLLIVVFIRTKEKAIPLSLLKTGWNRLVILCWMILPALNYAGLWDSYLSCRLYSGHLPHMALCLRNPSAQPELTPFFSPADGYKVCSGDAMVNLQGWSLKELGVPPYPELRVYKKIAAEWQASHPDTGTRIEYYFIRYSRVIERITPP